MAEKIIWLDGDLVDWDEATVHITSFGLNYGIGFFEGIRCHSTPSGPAVFRLADHMKRLGRSAAVYGIELPFSAEQLARACLEVIAANSLSDCYVRPLAVLGEGANPLVATFRTAIIASTDGPLIGPPKRDGVKAMISGVQRLSANAIPPAAKATGQYLNSYLAQSEALRAGYDEAIMLNAAGMVTDGWAHNLFVVENGAVVTPPVSAGALPGITRDTVMTLAAEAGLAVHERDLVRSNLYLADECFLTGTAAGLVPVTSVDGRVVGAGLPGPVTVRLTEAFDDVVHGTSGAHQEWRELVP